MGRIFYLRTSRELVSGLLNEMPADPTDTEEMTLLHLFTDDLPKAIERTMDLDPWLGAHLADILQNQDLISPQVDMMWVPG